MRQIAIVLAMTLAVAGPATAKTPDMPRAGDAEAARDVDRAVVTDRLMALGLSEGEVAERIEALDDEGLAALAANPEAIAPATGVFVPEKQKTKDTWRAVVSCAVFYGLAVYAAWWVVDAVDPTVTRGNDY